MKNTRIQRRLVAWLLAVVTILLTTGCYTTKSSMFNSSPPGGNFKMVSKLVALPDYIPGLGTLYVDPATLPAGPFLGYDRRGKLSHVTYMIPISEMNMKKNFNSLGGSLENVSVNHTDISYNPGHPGVAEPHYHVTQWLIDADAKKKM